MALEDHGLGFEEGEQSPSSAFPADAGLLEPAERYAKVGTERVVSYRSRAQLPCDLAGTVDVVGEHRRVEAIDRVVRDRDRVLLVLCRDNAEDRPEDLFLCDDRGVVDVPEYRRLCLQFRVL